MKHTIPILDFDSDPKAIIRPRRIANTTIKRAVLSFFWEAVGEYANAHHLKLLASFKSEMPDIPLYVDEIEQFLLAPMPVGAPMAGAILEQIIALGVERIVVCGGAGVLDAIPLGNILIPTQAIRDEGTSYHYIEASQIAKPDETMLQETCDYFDKNEIPYSKVTTWTTDGFFRETPQKISLRKEQGASCVEMEASALFAIAQFRGVSMVQLLFSGDDVSGEKWDKRNWNKQFDTRRNLLNLSISICTLEL
jgi:purine-nucleoside phosphorylase